MTAATPVNTLSTYVPSYSYLSSPSNPSSQLYPSSTVTWPYCQGINPGPGPAYAPDYNPWQPALDPSAHAPVKPQYTLRSNTPQPYAQRVQTANPRLAPGGVGGLGFGLGWQQRDMQDYPSPSGSSTSVQTTSSYVSALPASVQSPSIPLMASPSLAGSSGSRQSSSRKSQEPPRNADGMLYCNHPEHALQPQPVFSRKCEWT